MKAILTFLLLFPLTILAAKNYQFELKVFSKMEYKAIEGAAVSLIIDHAVFLTLRTNADGIVRFTGLRAKSFSYTVTGDTALYKIFYTEEVNKKRKNLNNTIYLQSTPAHFVGVLNKITEDYFTEKGNALPIDTAGTCSNDFDSEASFPGGLEKMRLYLSNFVKYPNECVENGVEGKVFVSFLVQPDGSITNARVLRGVEPNMDREALLAVGSMPKWIPAVCNGKRIRTYFMMPISFKLF